MWNRARRPLHSEFRTYWSLRKTHRQPYVRPTVNKYSAFRCKSRYKSKGGVQGQNSPFTPVQFTTRICAFKWTKANPRKDYVPCAVESFTVYTCCSYYRRWIRTSLSSLQSHVLTSLHGRPQARAREGGSFDPPGRLKHSSVTAS